MILENGDIMLSKEDRVGFAVIAVSENIYIFTGTTMTGKSQFARSIKNSVIVDDLSMFYKRSTIIDAVSNFKKGFIEKFALNGRRAQPLDKDHVLIFIANDPNVASSIKEDILETLTQIRYAGGVQDEKQYDYKVS